MAGLGFFAGGLADSLSAGFSRNQQAQFQQQELQLQQQGQQMAQQRFELSRVDKIIADAADHLQQTIDAGKVAGEDPKKIQGAIQGMFDQYRKLTTTAGRGQGFADAQLATWMAAPASTAIAQAQARAKETPSVIAERESLAAYRRSQADPFGLSGGGTIPGGIGFNETVTGQTTEELPPGAPLPIGGQRTAQANTASASSEQEKGDAFLASIPNPTLAAAVKAVANYEVNPNSFLSRGTMASRAQFLGLVQQYAESRGQKYDQTDFTAKNKAMQGFATRVQAISLADSELRRSLPILQSANQAVDRTQYKTINKVIEAWQEGTGGTAVVQLGEALNTTVNLYARAINPTGGKPTVNDLNHANEVLQKAWSKGQIEAGIQQLLQEVDAAKASLPDARNEILGILSGKQPAPSAKTGTSGTSSGVRWSIEP